MQKHDDLLGVPQTTFNKEFFNYRIKQHIHTCVPDSGGTCPSLYHFSPLNSIISIHKDQNDKSKGLINIYNDQAPYYVK